MANIKVDITIPDIIQGDTLPIRAEFTEDGSPVDLTDYTAFIEIYQGSAGLISENINTIDNPTDGILEFYVGSDTTPQIPAKYTSAHIGIKNGDTPPVIDSEIAVFQIRRGTGDNVAIDLDTGAASTNPRGAGIGLTLNGNNLDVDNPFTDAYETKLDGIEDDATADQTGTEIVDAINTEIGNNDWQTQGAGTTPRGAGTGLSLSGNNLELSDERYTSTEKTKLSNIESGAEANVGQTYTQTEKTKLSGVATGAEVNVQSNWNSNSGDSRILNKPTIPTARTNTEIDNRIASYARANSPSGTIPNNRIPSSIARDSELPASNRLIPSGGNNGQVLKKSSNSNYATEWADDETASGTGSTDLSIANRGANTLDINSSSGADVTVPAATSSASGLMTSADKTKLAGIDAGADANIGVEYTQTEKTKLSGVDTGATDDQTGTEIVDAIDTELGNEDWKTQGSGGGGGEAPTRANIYPLVKDIIIDGSNITSTDNDTDETVSIAASSSAAPTLKMLVLEPDDKALTNVSATFTNPLEVTDTTNELVNEGGIFSYTTGADLVITVSEAGVYEMEALIWVNQTDGARTVVGCRFQTQASGGLTVSQPGEDARYIRGATSTNGDHAVPHPKAVANLTANSTILLQLNNTTGAFPNYSIDGDKSMISVRKLN